MFYCYRQMNPDGTFVVNDSITVNVIIEADSDQEADSKAEQLGISFDSLTDDATQPPRWDSARGYAAFTDPSRYVRAAKHYDLSNVAVGEAFCYVYDSAGQKQSFVREQ